LARRFFEKSQIEKLYHKINKLHKIRIPIRAKSLPQFKKISQVFSDSFDPFPLILEGRIGLSAAWLEVMASLPSRRRPDKEKPGQKDLALN
jgi:hypothetical protein